MKKNKKIDLKSINHFYMLLYTYLIYFNSSILKLNNFKRVNF